MSLPAYSLPSCANAFSRCFTNGQWRQMNMTNSPFDPAAAWVAICFPVTTSVRAICGAEVPNASIEVSAGAIFILFCYSFNAVFHKLKRACLCASAVYQGAHKPDLWLRVRAECGRGSHAELGTARRPPPGHLLPR